MHVSRLGGSVEVDDDSYNDKVEDEINEYVDFPDCLAQHRILFSMVHPIDSTNVPFPSPSHHVTSQR